MRQVNEDADGLHDPEQSATDATVLECVCQSDAYRNRLNRELAGLSMSLPSMHMHMHTSEHSFRATAPHPNSFMLPGGRQVLLSCL